ncbi:MAG: hypothetical protein ACOCZQ_03475 [Nanoarchaeota archaeon]
MIETINTGFSNFFSLFDSVIEYIYMTDEIFGILTFIIAMLISYYSYKIFNFTKKKDYLWFSGGFYLIAIGFLTRFIFDFSFDTMRLDKTLFFGTMEIEPFKKIILITSMLFIFAGYILLLLVALKTKKRVSLLIFIISLVALLVSQNYYFTFLAVLAVVIFTLLFHFYRNFNQKRTLNSGVVWYSFLLLFVGCLMEMLMFISNKFYILSNIFNMGGFLLLLVNFLLVLRK